MKLAFLMTTLLSAAAFAAPQAPQSPQAVVRFNTNVSRPAPSFMMIPAFAIGGSGVASYSPATTSLSNIRSETSSGTNMEAGFLAEFGRHSLVFQTGLMYKQHQFNLSMTDESSYYDTEKESVDMALKYLSIPLMLKSRVRVAEGIRLAGRVGAELAFFMGGHVKSDDRLYDSNGQVIGQKSYSGDIDNSGKSNVRPVNAYLTVGAGPEFRVARNQNVRLEGFYERMMLPVTMHTDADLKIHSWNAMLSYAVGF